MPGLSWTDFSGGMISDTNEINVPENTFKTLQNVDVWSELGVAKNAPNLAVYDAFPTDKVYDHHVVFPAHGVKDYAIIMMSDGTIYAFDGSVPSFTSIGSVTAGARMAYANDRVYVFYRNMTAPTTGNTVRKVIEFDYSTSTFSISDAFIDEDCTIEDTTAITNELLDHYIDNNLYRYKILVTSNKEQDASESFGLSKSGFVSGADSAYFFVKESTVSKLRVYVSYAFIPNKLLTPAWLFDIDDVSSKSYVPIPMRYCERNSGNHKQLYVYTEYDLTGGIFWFHLNLECFWILTTLCDLHLNSALDYLAPAHKVRIAGEEYTIDTIVDDVAGNKRYVITFTEDIPPIDVEGGGDLWEWELAWIGSAGSKQFFIPIQNEQQNFVQVPVDENRPESKYTNGTGNLLAPLGNYLFTANPYFPDTYSTGDDLDKKGWLSWSWITGEGLYATELLPDINLITSPGFSSEIIDMIDFKENLLVFHKGGLVRFVLENGIPFPFDSDEDGVDDDFNYYKDNFRFFIYSNQKVKQAVFSRQNVERGEIKFVEISRAIASLVKSSSGVDARFCYEPEEKLLYFTDIDGNINSYICSLRDGKPKWIKHVNTYGAEGEADLHNSFVLNGTVYFVGNDDGTYKVWTKTTSSNLQDLTIESNNVYLPLGEDTINQIEIVYQQSANSFVFDVYLDDSKIYTETITETKSAPGFYKIRFPRTSVTRFNKLRWKLTKTLCQTSDNFKFYGVFVNRQDYGRETARGY